MPGRARKSTTAIVVGTGPAGIFTAMELVRLQPRAKILLLDKGPDISRRRCLRQDEGGPCRQCRRCLVLSGWGGAGAFSDGKLNLSTEVGGTLGEFLAPGASLDRLIDDVDRIYLEHGAPRKVYSGGEEQLRRLMDHFEKNRLQLVPSRIRHLGTDRCQAVLREMRNRTRRHVETVFNREVVRLIVEEGRVRGVVDEKGGEHRARYVILAPGRGGAEWLTGETARLGLPAARHPVDIGVRVEVSSSITAALTELLYEAKIRFISPSFRDPVRTFCMCPEGEVVVENSAGVTLVNGQSYGSGTTGRTNFAILVSTNFTHPFREPIAYGKYIARLANILGGGIIVQRLGDLREGRRSTNRRIAGSVLAPSLSSATAGDLSFVLPFRLLTGILEMIEALGRAVPGIDNPETLLYGVEAKFYSLKLELGRGLETGVKNLFVVGDGAGVSRGLVQASASGLVAAREIAARLERGEE